MTQPVTRLWVPESKEREALKVECMRSAAALGGLTPEAALFAAKAFYEWIINGAGNSAN